MNKISIACALGLCLAFVASYGLDRRHKQEIVNAAFAGEEIYDARNFVMTADHTYDFRIEMGDQEPIMVRCNDWDWKRNLPEAQDDRFRDTCGDAVMQTLDFLDKDDVEAATNDVQGFTASADYITILDPQGQPFCRADSTLPHPLIGQTIGEFLENKLTCAAAIQVLVWPHV